MNDFSNILETVLVSKHLENFTLSELFNFDLLLGQINGRFSLYRLLIRSGNQNVNTFLVNIIEGNVGNIRPPAAIHGLKLVLWRDAS